MVFAGSVTNGPTETAGNNNLSYNERDEDDSEEPILR